MRHTVVDRRLGDRIEAPEEYVGHRLYDPSGKRIGRVEEVFVGEEDEPEYIRAKVGPLGLKSILIPVDAVAVDEKSKSITLQ